MFRNIFFLLTFLSICFSFFNFYSQLSEDDIILDIGCGSGRFIDVIKNGFNNKIIGIDYSSAVQVAYNSFKHNPNICIVQADALMLPFKSNRFYYEHRLTLKKTAKNRKEKINE